ncbi:hypothetical protein MLD38_001282 [Melastoma candidum]|uniref:Uncharacterized protein n=1 Tax=Melastoma candidum TaxID=119954 RepID=A0ACB9SHP2_9MYRT|nr:hypothetical protein MLD38_001282 [Melastoma candidum]
MEFVKAPGMMHQCELSEMPALGHLENDSQHSLAFLTEAGSIDGVSHIECKTRSLTRLLRQFKAAEAVI